MKRTVTFHTVHNQKEMLAQGLPIDFPQEEELPLPAQHAQATTAGPLAVRFDTANWNFSLVLEPAT